ncbi:4-(cytidine 5'-diphospho)-2-C-methyl-D-erythritol kinase [Iocasia frigidifontis]|uniref:4-diphosphocytidyl-2-C-methyl-D-erythritol kinase n=1 Tax=Iocasia fonsfrigidae TaxID=2682810 RepID=A0A8A7KN02_9FIRM|nr:4-(cytidine 5'-diphospho)-2-C-methyl-D-erythritol kinase [Iocasia fonsfrigidae]QTL99444.1 4-(cytidine 5'-diphospho)-2-C-methyl-D-erythritol kinase [Iocasia fonsfrigidae]
MHEINLKAPAKINIALDITGLYDDGYHQVEMIMQTVSLYDKVIIRQQESGIQLAASAEELPTDQGNIAYRAAEMILNEADLNVGVDIYIEKKIPIAAGLAGGSTDAAAVLKGINSLYNLKFDFTRLSLIAAKLGSDVPFCLNGGTAYAYERGDKLKQLPDIRKTHFLIVTPPVPVSTAEVYQKYDFLKPDINVPVNKLLTIIQGQQQIKWNEGWANVLEGVTTHFLDDILEIKGIMMEMGVVFTMMSGSGPTVFGIVKDSKQAEHIVENWPRKGDFITNVSGLKAGVC